MKFRFLILTKILLFSVGNFLFGQQYEVNFDEKYKCRNEDNVSIEISPVQELVYIILSNTNSANEVPHMVKRDTEYYTRMSNHFMEYSDMPIVKEFDELLRENLLYYFILAGNAYGYEFKDNKIKPTGIYIYPAKGVGNLEITEENPIKKFIPELEDYAQKSNFKEFYNNNRSYYNNLIEEYENYAEIEKQKSWLENRFNYKINSFRVLTSPLINGMNATHTFENNDFKETLLFLPTIKYDSVKSKQINKANNTRIIFTEIDHNYVGIVSEKFKERINQIFGNREEWLDGKNEYIKYYPNPIKVFDEYLTWGLFILYAKDNYDQKTLDEVIDNINEKMLIKGFPKAEEFNINLLQIYNSTSEKNIELIYPKILDWSEKQ